MPSPHPVVALVQRASGRPPGDLSDVVSAVAHECWGAGGTAVYLVTLEQTELVPLRRSRRTSIPLGDTQPARCFTSGRTVVEPGSPPTTWVPLTHRGDRLGVLAVVAPTPPATDELIAFADAVALHLVADGRVDDAVTAVRRTQEMGVGAELLAALLPPLSYADRRVSVAAVLEPTYSAGGDVVDHAVEGDVLRMLLLDATGHGRIASLVSTSAAATYRSARRAGQDLVGTWEALDRHLDESGGPDDAHYATALLLELDLGTGRVGWLTAGHPPPVVVRRGGRVDVLEAEAAPPLGTGLGGPPDLAEEYLEPGDVLALHTDGITEARTLDGDLLGLDAYLDVLRVRLPEPGPLTERLRRVRLDLLADDAWMGDDATTVLVEWHG